MCGIVGIAGVMPVNQSIYDALTVLQHRGQDAAGIITIDANNCFRLRKANGLVNDIFEARHMQRLQGNMGIGHVRYPTAGSSSASEAQPFYVNSPYGITLAHNGNLTNAHELRKKLFEEKRRHINTTSDSEILLNIFASELDNFRHYPLEADNIFAAIAATNRQIRGAYACVAMIIGHGMVAFRDPHGIRPLVLGKRDVGDGRTEYMVASESVALDTLGFEFLRDVAPGEAIYITEKGQLFTRQCADNPVSNPCLFEYVYFARPDSFIDKISVYSARVNMGTKLGEKIAREWEDLDIDVVIPIPETSCDIALEIARILGKPYRQGFVKIVTWDVPLSCRANSYAVNPCAVSSMLIARNSAIRTSCWWMIPSCVAPHQSRLSRWPGKPARRRFIWRPPRRKFVSPTSMALICRPPMS